MEEGEGQVEEEKVLGQEEEEEDSYTGLAPGVDDQCERLPVVCVAGSFHQTVLAANPRNQV